jgi:IMP dehydrogenase
MSKKTYTFNDVLIKPQYSEVTSRKNVDLSVNVKDLKINIPVISANMKSITGPRMATEMGIRGGWGILHRFNSIEGAVSDYEEASEQNPGVSIGVNGDYMERFNALYTAGARYFCIDVAHGHHALMKNAINSIKSEFEDIFVIAGNTATVSGAIDIRDWGADAVKIGIGPGAVCQTRTNTGVGVPQLSALEEVHKAYSYKAGGIKIIADGGIKTIGDIAKALAFSDMVMLGSFFAGTMETPGNVYKDASGSRYKVYGGSASGDNKDSNGKKVEFVEGVTTQVPLGDHVKFLLKEIKEGVQSSCSYVGANNLNEFKEKCEFIHISGGGKEESKL